MQRELRDEVVGRHINTAECNTSRATRVVGPNANNRMSCGMSCAKRSGVNVTILTEECYYVRELRDEVC